MGLPFFYMMLGLARNGSVASIGTVTSCPFMPNSDHFWHRIFWVEGSAGEAIDWQSADPVHRLLRLPAYVRRHHVRLPHCHSRRRRHRRRRPDLHFD